MNLWISVKNSAVILVVGFVALLALYVLFQGNPELINFWAAVVGFMMGHFIAHIIKPGKHTKGNHQMSSIILCGAQAISFRVITISLEPQPEFVFASLIGSFLLGAISRYIDPYHHS